MPGIHHNPIRFSGYKLAPNGQADLYLPGYWDSQKDFQFKVKAKVIDGEKTHTVGFTHQGNYWKSNESLPLGAMYRIQVEEQYNSNPIDVLDLVQTRKIGDETFNVISPYEASAPRKSVVMADIFLDSVVSKEKLLSFLHQYDQGDKFHTVRNHFNQFGGDELGLKEVLPILKSAGFTGLLLKPFIGGDNLSSHRYWTTDPYVLNNSFSSKGAFKGFLKDSLKNGMKLYSDGAFVNMGLNAPQFWSNLHDGFRSPYWDWFTYDQNPDPKAQTRYPREAFEKHSLGILPSKTDPKTGMLTSALEHVAVRFLNEPDKAGYDERKPIFVEFYDPSLETADGKPLVPDYKIHRSEDSILKYRFPVSADEVREKRRQEKKLKDPMEKRQLYLEWDRFRLVPSSRDGLPVKWNGQIDVAKLNMKNPEVQEYLTGAVDYWTRFVQNSYIEEVGRQLTLARRKNPSGTPMDWLNSITLSEPEATVPDKLIKPVSNQKGGPVVEKVLPPVIQPDLDMLPTNVCFEAIGATENMKSETPEKSQVELLRAQYYLSSLEMPAKFKATLCHPDLKRKLQQEEFPALVSFVGWVLSPIIKPLKRFERLKVAFEQVEELFRPTPFDRILERKLREVVPLLSKENQERFKYTNLQSLATESLGEGLYLHLLTNQNGTTAEEIEHGFYQTVDQAIHGSDPETGKDLLVRFLKRRLKATEPKRLADILNHQLEGLDPQMASLAQAVLNRREIGLNWRIDAAKDVGDMDKVWECETPSKKTKRFSEEIEFVKQFWEQMAERVRGIFPKSTTIAELTDFEILSSPDVAKKSFEKLFDANVFNGTPNMSYMFSTPTRLVHYAPKPHEFGDQQMKPSEFMNAVRTMSQAVPFPALRQYQNLTASHDYPNTCHSLLINPDIATMDLLKWWGLKDDLREIANELKSKPGFELERDRLNLLGVNNLDNVLERLIQRSVDPEMQKWLSPAVWEYFSENQKKLSKDGGKTFEWIGATPIQIKRQFIKELFALVSPGEIGLPDKVTEDALQEILMERISEPSEARAMRAVITNNLQKLDWGGVAERLGIPVSSTDLMRERLQLYIHQAIGQAIGTFGRQWGYQPLEIALDHVFERMPSNWTNKLPGSENPGLIQKAISEQLYQQAMTPVLDKLTRILALQVAVPGNPSVYLPDLLGQTGSELVKNMFVQNRNLIRHDWLDKKSKLDDKPYLREFYQEASQILKLRSRYPVLNDGIVLEPQVNDEDGVVPIIRDNGKDQAILLVNTGKPSGLVWDNKMGDGALYKEINLADDRRQIYGYRLNMSPLRLQPYTTRYVDPENGEEFVLNEQSVLVKALDHNQGIDLTKPYRLLMRKQT